MNPTSNEIMLRSVVRGHLTYGPQSLNEALLQEGITDGLFKDAVQFIVSGAAEYGLGAVTLPAAGAGLAVGPTVETVVDAAFAAESVASTVSAVANVGSMMKEYGALWDEAVAAYGGDLKSYYQTLIKIIQKAITDIGAKAGDAIDKVAEKLQGGLEKLIGKLVDALKSGIKLVIPDATISVVAAKAFQTAMEALANNAFDLLVSAVEKVDMLKKFVADPSVAVDFFRDIFDQVTQLMIDAGKKLNDMGWAEAIMKGGLGGGAILKKLGPEGLQKAADALSKQAPKVLDVIDQVLTVLVPTAITAVALFQAMITGEWKEGMDKEGEEKKGEEKKAEEKKPEPPKAESDVPVSNTGKSGAGPEGAAGTKSEGKEAMVKISKRALRLMIKEALEPIISESTLYVSRSTYGITVEDQDDNYVSFGEMILDLFSAGDDDIFYDPQGVNPQAKTNLLQKHEEGVQGGMERWDSDVFSEYYSVDLDRVIRLYARRHNLRIEEMEPGHH